MTQETKDEEYNLAQGPFMRSEEDETQLEETMQKARNEEKSGTFLSNRELRSHKVFSFI